MKDQKWEPVHLETNFDPTSDKLRLEFFIVDKDCDGKYWRTGYSVVLPVDKVSHHCLN